MKYSEDFKKRIVDLYLEGYSSELLAREYGVSTSSISNWVKKVDSSMSFDGLKKFIETKLATEYPEESLDI